MNVLSLEDVSKVFAHPTAEITVLKGICASVAQGERVAILGPSGSGKSTLLSLLAGLDLPSSGCIKVLGKTINDLSERELAVFRSEHIGIVFQQFHLMSSLTAVENVSLPLDIRNTPNAEDAAKKALDDVGLAERYQHFPHELSGGECQRVAIARAMITRPSLLLADEPSGNLDSKTGEQVMKLLFDLAQRHKLSLVLVTHNPELASWCDRQLHLNDGALVDA